ncbi:MAG: c-type cytochrome domain-containing protein [Planctomycetota bacterium]|nr:c-type cytochrome domain-containing protein [Planctomycetota bacterium]MEC8855383.1 c-type cytochrome domain-containing protein [Planctomycetota bacterium]
MAESELQNVLLQTVGRSHPLLVHFPVALLVVAAASELGGLWRRSPEVGAMARGLVWFALPATFAAAFAGWTMSERDPVSRAMASTLEWHRWTGVGVLALTVLCVLLRQKTSAFRGALFCGAIGVGVTGHLGGTMSWGDGYLLEPIQSWRAANARTEPAPESVAGLENTPAVPVRPAAGVLLGGPSSLDVSEETKPRLKDPEAESTPIKMEFVKDIQPILERYCVECHGPRKKKGGLRLEPIDAAFPTGDEDFWTMLPGDGESSLLVQRMLLPRDDDEAMPPKGDAVPADEIQKVITWINAGAHGPGLEHIKRAATKAVDERRLDPLGVLEPTEAEQALIDTAVAALRDRGVVVQAVAQRHYGLEVNLSLLRPAASDEHLDLLRGLEPVLVRLDLSRTAVTDEGFAQVAALPELRDLRLGGTQLGDAIAPVLKQSPKLTRLNLYGTKCSEALLPTLSNLESLERLHIWGSKISGDSAIAFATANPELRVTGLPPVVREPIPEVVVDPESIAEVQPELNQPTTSEVDSEPASEEVHFLTKIRPILEARCVSCHGPKKKKGGLRLEPIAEAFPKGEEDWWTILPGDPAGSLLVERIKLTADDDGVMPPRGELLTKEEISLIEQWIARGAKHTN